MYLFIFPLLFRLMPIIRENRLFIKIVQNLNEFAADMIPKQKLLIATALALLVDTEDFIIHRDQYITCREDVEDLVRCKEQVLTSLMTDLEKKRVIRPLVDSIDKAKRQLRFK